MQSTLAATTRRFNRVFFKQLRPRKLASASTGRTADPTVHSAQDPGIYDDETLIAASQKENKPSIEKEPLVPPKPPYPPSPKLESTGVSPPIDPTTQQKRQSSTSTTAATTAPPPPIEDVNCAGLDGTPWPEHTIDRRKERKEQEEYDKEYFKHHKPSPLSEVKMVDTRKPITRATDGTVEDSYYDVEGGGGVTVWRPEQLDTAEETLYRAAEIWRQNAMRGDPDSPHGKVLRILRGENW